MEKHIPLATPTMCGKEFEFVKNAFDTNWIAPLGPHVDAFEKEIAEKVGMKYAAAVSSATAGIHLALVDAGIHPGDVVFCSDMTFCAAANPIVYCGGTPVFIDCNLATFNMDVSSLKKAFEKYPLPKAVITSHLYGQSCDMDPILDLCKKHNAIVVEDAAESLGATYKGKMSGTFGKYGIYSFNGNKIITTSGGGMVVSNDARAIEHIKFLSTQAREKTMWYEHKEIGYNYRLSNVCAAIGRGQLTVLDERVKQKKAIYQRYVDGFSDMPKLFMMPEAPYGSPNHWLSALCFDSSIKKTPFELVQYLKDNNVESRPIWKPLHMQPIYSKADFISSKRGIPMDEDIFFHGICLPSDVKMDPKDQDSVIELIKEFFR